MHFQKLQEVYQETGTDRLIQIISGKLGEKRKQESQLQETLKRKNEYYMHLADGMPVGISVEAGFYPESHYRNCACNPDCAHSARRN